MTHFTQIVFNSECIIVTKKAYESQDLMKIILNKITFHTKSTPTHTHTHLSINPKKKKKRQQKAVGCKIVWGVGSA